MVSLRGHFSGDISDQILCVQATVNFDKLFYRSERQLSFESFFTKSTNAHNDKERSGRTMSDPDIVNAIWYKVQCSKLEHYKSALQVHQFLNPCVWKNILDTLSAQVSKLIVSKPISNVSEVSQSNRYTRDDHFPDSKVRTSDGSIFIGNHPDNKWRSESVKP